MGSAREQAVSQSCKTAAATLVRASDNYYLDAGTGVSVAADGSVTTDLSKYLKNNPPYLATKSTATYYLVATVKGKSITVQGKDSATGSNLTDCTAG